MTWNFWVSFIEIFPPLTGNRKGVVLTAVNINKQTTKQRRVEHSYKRRRPTTKYSNSIHTVIKVRLYAVNKIWLGHISTFVSSSFMPLFSGLAGKPFIQNTFPILPDFISIGHVFLYLKYPSLLRCLGRITACASTSYHYI